MKLIYFSNEFPHDDVPYIARQLHVHSKSRNRRILATFLEEATSAVREEVRKLPASQSSLIPPFNTVLDFADNPQLRNGPLNGSIDGVLLCVIELALFIGYVTHSILRKSAKPGLSGILKLREIQLRSIPRQQVLLVWASVF